MPEERQCYRGLRVQRRSTITVDYQLPLDGGSKEWVEMRQKGFNDNDNDSDNDNYALSHTNTDGDPMTHARMTHTDDITIIELNDKTQTYRV